MRSGWEWVNFLRRLWVNCAQNKNRRVPEQAPYIIPGTTASTFLHSKPSTQFSLHHPSASVTMNNSNQQQPLLPVFFNLFVMQALLQYQLLTTMWHQSGTPIMEPFYGLPSHALPTMAQQQEDQHRASTSSPSHNRHGRRRRKAVARTPHNIVLASSAMIPHDHSPSILPGIARMDASNNTGAGGVRSPPSRNTSMVDRNSGRQKRKKPYHRYRSGKSQNHRDIVDPSVYQIPFTDSEGMLIS